jgi:hypothetical protein
MTAAIQDGSTAGFVRQCFAMSVTVADELSEGELNILVDGLSDEVAFFYVIIHLGLLEAVDEAAPGPTRTRVVNAAIESLQRLIDRGLLLVGHTRFVEEGGPPAPGRRLTPYEHVPEEPVDVWQRLRTDSLSPVSDDLYWSCWCVNTAAGNKVARAYLDEQVTSE